MRKDEDVSVRVHTVYKKTCPGEKSIHSWSCNYEEREIKEQGVGKRCCINVDICMGKGELSARYLHPVDMFRYS